MWVKTRGEVVEKSTKQTGGAPLPLPHAAMESHMQVRPRPAIADTTPRGLGEKSQKKRGMPGLMLQLSAYVHFSH